MEADVVAVLTIRDGDRLEVWLREGMSADAMADLLYDLGDRFASGSAKRVQ